MRLFSKGLFGFAGTCLVIGLVMCAHRFRTGRARAEYAAVAQRAGILPFRFQLPRFLGQQPSPGPLRGRGGPGVLSDDQAAGVHALDIDVAAGSVRLREGDAFAVEASAGSAGVPEYDWGTDNGTFYLRTDDARRFALEKSCFHRYGARAAPCSARCVFPLI